MENHGFQIKIPWIFMENDGFPWKTVVFPWFSMVFHGHHGKISAGNNCSRVPGSGGILFEGSWTTCMNLPLNFCYIYDIS